MPKSILRLGVLALLIAITGAHSLEAQSGSSGQSTEQSQAQPAPSDEAPGKATKTEPGKAKKAKKVWTEEDMQKLGSKVSVVGDSNRASAAGSPTTAGSGNASYYRERLTPLRQELEHIDAKIRDLQNAKLGGRDNIARPLERLEAQKKDVQAKIDAIEDEARKNGIEPGQLR